MKRWIDMIIAHRNPTGSSCTTWIAIAMALALTSCLQTPQPADQPVATYVGGEVTAKEYAGWLTVRELPEVPEDPLPEIRELVLIKVLAARAVEDGLDRDPRVAIQTQAVEDGQLANAWKRQLAQSITVDQAEIDRVAAANPAAFIKPRRYRLRNLFKRIPTDASSEGRAAIRDRMEDLHAQLLAGANMAKLALAESDSETRYREGRMGVIEEQKLPPALAAVVREMTDGDYSEVLESPTGFTIIKCEKVIEATRPGPQEVRAKIEKNLARPLRRQAIEEGEKQLLADSGLVIDIKRAMNPSGSSEDVIATFGSDVISRDELEQLKTLRQARGTSGPGSEGRIRGLIEAHVVTTLAADRARAMGLDDRELTDTIKWRTNAILATEVLSRSVQQRIDQPTEAEIRAAYDADPDQYQHPPEIDLMVIRWGFSDDTVRTVHDRAVQALDAIDTKSMSFEEAARRFSDSTQNGEPLVLTVTPRQFAGLGPSVHKAARSLEVGGFSRLIRQDNEFWIVKLLDKRPPTPMSLEEAAGEIRNRLGQQRVDQISSEIESEILAELRIELLNAESRRQ